MPDQEEIISEKATQRGERRRTVQINASAEETSVSASAAEGTEAAGKSAAKRTTKTSTPKTSAKSASAKSTTAKSVEASEESAPAASEQVATAPKRRGRPPKAKAEAEAAEAAVAEASADATASASKARKSTSKKPEQPKAQEEAPSAPDSEAPAEGAQSPSPEAHPARRARGRQKRIETSSSFASSTLEQAGEAATEASAQTDAPDTPAQDQKQKAQTHYKGAQSAQNPAQHQSQGQNQNNRNNRNNRAQNGRAQLRDVAPSITAQDLEGEDIEELYARAGLLDVAVEGLEREELISAIVTAQARLEGFREVEGILDVLSDGYGFLRTSGYLPGEHDVYVATPTIRKNGLRRGDMVSGVTRPARENEKYPALQKVLAVNGTPVEELGTRVKFADLTPVYPDERLVMEHGKSALTARVIDLVAPIGKGQRGLIVSPPKAGKTTILKDIAASITANNPEVHLMCLLVDERPEEVTDMQRSIHGEVISSTFDMPCENHIAVAELVIERAKRLVECGQDVVILLDSITRLARAYNLAQPASGRILSGGVDSTALYPPKRFLGAARNIEGGGSLTILASALIDTGSKMDEVIFEEFKGTGNMELKLDRNLADRRIFPAIDPVASGTRKEELLLDSQEAPLIWAVRRILANLNNTERAMDMLIKSLKATDNNVEFLIRTAKKAQGRKGDEIIDL